MIIDSLQNLRRYAGLGYGLPQALRFLAENDLTRLEPGRHDLAGEDLFAVVQDYVSRPVELGTWEAHRRYIDVHYVVSGHERIGFADLQTLQVGDYLPDKDFLPVRGEGSTIKLAVGSFVILFPEDAHMPGLADPVPMPIRKVVLKARYDDRPSRGEG